MSRSIWLALAALLLVGLAGESAVAVSEPMLLMAGQPDPSVQLLPRADSVLIWSRDLERLGYATMTARPEGVTLTRGTRILQFEAGRPTAKVDDQWVRVPTPAIEYEGKLMVPLDFVCHAFEIGYFREPRLLVSLTSPSLRPDHPDPNAAGAISGRVAFAGKPAPGIVLRLVNAADFHFVPDRRALTGPDGRYAFSGVPAGKYRVYAYVEDNPGYFNRVTDPVEVAEQTVEAPDLELGRALQPLAPLTGPQPAGEPIAFGWTPSPAAASYELTVTDPDGKIAFTRIVTAPIAAASAAAFQPGREYRIQVIGKDAQGHFVAGTAGEGAAPWTFTVAPAAGGSHATDERLPTAAFNQKVEQAAKDGESWPRSAVLVALKLVGESIESSTRVVEVQSAPEQFDAAAITITDEGCLDDSVRGYRYRLQLQKTAEGFWEITEAFKAWNCWRGHADFSTESCA